MAIREGNDNGLPYRSPVTGTGKAYVPVSTDEEKYDTLKAVESLFASAIEGLYKEFNAFDVLKDGTTPETIDKMMRQIAGNQIAYDICAPLLEAVQTAIRGADNRHIERNTPR